MIVSLTEMRNTRGTRLYEKNHMFNFCIGTFEIPSKYLSIYVIGNWIYKFGAQGRGES